LPLGADLRVASTPYPSTTIPPPLTVCTEGQSWILLLAPCWNYRKRQCVSLEGGKRAATALLHTNYKRLSGLQAANRSPDGACSRQYPHGASHTSSLPTGTACLVSAYVLLCFSTLASATALTQLSKSLSLQSPPPPLFSSHFSLPHRCFRILSYTPILIIWYALSENVKKGGACS
jgi:hypothetical protein